MGAGVERPRGERVHACREEGDKGLSLPLSPYVSPFVHLSPLSSVSANLNQCLQAFTLSLCLPESLSPCVSSPLSLFSLSISLFSLFSALQVTPSSAKKSKGGADKKGDQKEPKLFSTPHEILHPALRCLRSVFHEVEEHERAGYVEAVCEYIHGPGTELQASTLTCLAEIMPFAYKYLDEHMETLVQVSTERRERR